MGLDEEIMDFLLKRFVEGATQGMNYEFEDYDKYTGGRGDGIYG
jgi:hypothetical protein